MRERERVCVCVCVCERKRERKLRISKLKCRVTPELAASILQLRAHVSYSQGMPDSSKPAEPEGVGTFGLGIPGGYC